MKNLLLVILLGFGATGFAQVGINNTDPKATLDITAKIPSAPENTEGILIPRISAFPATQPTAEQNGMLVFLTTNVGLSTSGFYYWDEANTQWAAMGDGTGADTQDLSIDNTKAELSLIEGGMVEIKTIADNDDDTLIQVEENADEDIIRFDVGGIEKLTLNSKGQLEFLNTGNSVFIGEDAGNLDDGTNNNIVAIGKEAARDAVDVANITAVGNQAARRNTEGGNSVFGAGGMYNATTGESNTVIGTFAMYFPSAAGNFNTAVGYQSMGSGSFGGGDRNTGIGGYSLYASDGDYNTGVGYGASRELEAGNNNTAIGYNAGQDTEVGSNSVYVGYLAGGGNATGAGRDFTRSNNIFIGAEAGTEESTSNKLYIESSSSVTPLLYGEFDNDVLRVNGQLQIGASDDTTAASIYAFPISDGSNGQVLTTDGMGAVTWQSTSSGTDTQDLSINNTTADLTLVNGGTVELKTIADSDDDTLIQVEESADEDIIRFDVEGTEKLTINSQGQLQFINTGSAVFIGEGAGANDDLSTNRNVLIGFNAGNLIENSYNNVAIGFKSMDAAVNNVGNNVALGNSSLGSVTTAENNVALGVSALGATTASTNNVAIGTNAMSNTTSGDNNIAIGRSAGANSDGNDNVFIGYEADLTNNNAGVSRNVIIGAQAGENLNGQGDDLSGRVIIGYQAGNNDGTSNKLYLENSNTATPLVGGDFTNDRLGINVDMSSNAANLTHTLTVGGTAKIQDVLNLEPGTTPVTPAAGDIYFDSSDNTLKCFDGTAWQDLF